MSFRKCVLASLSGAMLVFCGCEKPSARAQSPPPAPANPVATAPTNAPFGFSPTNAQPKLKTIKLWLGPEVITAELALSMPQIMTGMMFRKEMAENEGMLFVFARPHQVSFYMRNTLLALSCAYIDPDGTILELHEMKPLDETPIPAKSDNVQYVLE